jgi:hypothetical protein
VAITKELHDIIAVSSDIDLTAGSWIYFDMQTVLKSILDTAKNPKVLEYKKNLLDSANMALTAMESIMTVTFIIDTKKEMSPELQTFLQTKPSVKQQGDSPAMQYLVKLFLLQPNKLEISLDGFFPMVGQFVSAEIK